MIRFVLGVIVGIMIATVGFSGMARVIDKGVMQVQEKAKELTK